MKEKYMKPQIKNKPGRTNWRKIQALTEAEIMEAAQTDPDALPLTDEELEQFKKVTPPSSVEVKRVRLQLKLTQKQMAAYFGVSIRTLQEWEQGRRKPATVARNFLKVIAREPKAVQRALRKG